MRRSVYRPRVIFALVLSLAATLPAASFSQTGIAAPETVRLKAERFVYRPAGAYLQDGNPVDPRLVAAALSGDLEIAVNLVSVGDYERCVGAAACEPADIPRNTASDVPVTGVSFTDATAYAAWLSTETGQTWRLPTDREWTFAAGSRAVDDAVGNTDSKDPSDRWLAAYRKSAKVDRSAGTAPLPLGTFGTNENGLNDVSGNVWEWTDTCYERITLDVNRRHDKIVTNCGVRVVEGAHRAYISYFIRDARGGGCSAGTPPDNLGFRLVRELSLIDRFLWFFGRA